MFIAADDALSHYTALSKVVAVIVSVGWSVFWGFRGHAKFEPCEQDLPKVPQRVGGAVISVAVVLLFVTFGGSDRADRLVPLAVSLIGACVLSLFVYVFLQHAYTFESPDQKRRIRGFWLTQEAKQRLGEGHTIEGVLQDCENRREEVWPPHSVALAKVTFTAVSLLVTISGSMALASAGILLIDALARPIPVTVTVIREDVLQADTLCPNAYLEFEFDDGTSEGAESPVGRPRVHLLARYYEGHTAFLTAKCGRTEQSTKEKMRVMENAPPETLLLMYVSDQISDVLKRARLEFENGQYGAAAADAAAALRTVPNDDEALGLFKAAQAAQMTKGFSTQ